MLDQMIAFVLLQQPSPSASVQFLTLETLFSAAGATTAVITVTAVLNSLLPKFPARWFALVFSLCLTVIGIGVLGQPYRPATIFLACINGLVVYAAAVGVNNVSTSSSAGGGTGAPGAPQKSYRWFP
jgi:hypothetical protein